MPNCQFAADHGDQVAQVCSMTDKTQQRLVFVIDRLPVCAVHVCVVEIFTLNAPRFAVNLRPLGAWINAHLQLGYVQWTITNLRWSFSRDNTPTVGAVAGLVQQLFLIC